MKFTWFNLMPWPYMPDDFREKNRSVWVDIPNTMYDPRKGHFVYHQYMDQLEYAESVGFDGIGCNEHHQNGYGLMPSPNLIAAGLARRTSKAAIAVIGNSLALYNPPIRVAEEFAMLDVISGGRLLAGFPVGTSMDTNYCYGQIPALTRDKYAEAHDLVMRAWAEEEPFAFDGKYNQLRWVNCWPKPIQKPHPPIYIPGGGSIETWDFCLITITTTPISHSQVICAARNYLTAIGTRSPNVARTSRHIAAPSRKPFAWRTRMRKRKSCTPNMCTISTIVACMSMAASLTRRGIARSRRCKRMW